MPAVRHHHQRLTFVDHAVVVGHHHLYSTRDYQSVRVRHVDRSTVINNYKAAPVVHKTVIQNVNVTNQYTYVDRRVTVKPHHTVATQIKERQRHERRATAPAVSAQVQKAGTGHVTTDRRVKEPRVTSRVVRAEDAGKPQPEFREVRPKARADKPQARPAVVSTEPRAPKAPARGRHRTRPEASPAPAGEAPATGTARPQRPTGAGSATAVEPAKAPVPSRPAQETAPGSPQQPRRPERPPKAPPAKSADSTPRLEQPGRPASPDSATMPAKAGKGRSGAHAGDREKAGGPAVQQPVKPSVQAAERPQQPKPAGPPVQQARERQPRKAPEPAEEGHGKGKPKGD
jgi:hypothetical protein